MTPSTSILSSFDMGKALVTYGPYVKESQRIVWKKDSQSNLFSNFEETASQCYFRAFIAFLCAMMDSIFA